MAFVGRVRVDSRSLVNNISLPAWSKCCISLYQPQTHYSTRRLQGLCMVNDNFTTQKWGRWKGSHERMWHSSFQAFTGYPVRTLWHPPQSPCCCVHACTTPGRPSGTHLKVPATVCMHVPLQDGPVQICLQAAALYDFSPFVGTTGLHSLSRKWNGIDRDCALLWSASLWGHQNHWEWCWANNASQSGLMLQNLPGTGAWTRRCAWRPWAPSWPKMPGILCVRQVPTTLRQAWTACIVRCCSLVNGPCQNETQQQLCSQMLIKQWCMVVE